MDTISENWEGDSSIDSGAKMAEVCKPNYEERINQLKEHLSITRTFFNALETFVLKGPRTINKRNLKPLAGYLYFTMTELEINIDVLMVKAEKEA